MLAAGVLLIVTCGLRIYGQAAATLSGTVYVREEGIAYGTGQPTAPGIANAIVATDTTTTTSSGTGSYVTSIPAPGWVEVRASAAGSIPSRLRINPQPGESISRSIGLINPSPSVPARPGFVKGALTYDTAQILHYYLPGGFFSTTYARMREQLGTNLVAYCDQSFVTAYSTTANTVVMSTQHPTISHWRMLNENEYRELVLEARRNNQQFMLLLCPIAADPAGQYNADIYNVAPTQTAFWDSWFAAYEPIVVQYAVIARNLNIEFLALAHNLGYLSRLSAARWEHLIAAIRATGYQGNLVYFGFTDPFNMYWESDFYDRAERAGNPADFMRVFDYIGVSIVNVVPRPSLSGQLAPAQSRSALRQAIAATIAKTAAAPVPVLLLAATPSTHGGATENVYIEPHLTVSNVANTKTLDLQQQADVYQAVFEVISGTPTGRGRVAGLISWGYHLKDNYDDGFFVGEVAMDKSANIRSKPAEAVAQWWFDRFSTRPLRAFADTPLVRGLSVIRSVHVTGLRERVDGVRTNAGLVAYPWSESVAPGGLIRAQHFIELRQALNQAYAAAGRRPPTYTDLALQAGMPIKLEHMEELRVAVHAIE